MKIFIRQAYKSVFLAIFAHLYYLNNIIDDERLSKQNQSGLGRKQNTNRWLTEQMGITDTTVRWKTTSILVINL